jgi:hypothetical protein
VKDKAFFYFSGEIENRDIEGPRSFNNASGTSNTQGPTGWHDREIDVPRWLAKVDWNIIDGHTLEFTGVSDVRKEDRLEYGYYYTAARSDPDDLALPNNTKGNVANGGHTFEEGGELFIGRYTGALMDNLILTALYGTQKNDHKDAPFQYNPSVTTVRDDTAAANRIAGAYTVIDDPKAFDETDGYRIDLEWLTGAHSVRVGYDVQNLEYKDGRVTSGPGYIWIYDETTAADGCIPGSGGACLGGPGEFVQKVVSALGGTFTTDQYAYFIEDKWQVTDNVLLSLGLRNENFENYNADKVIFLDQTDQWAPRVGVTWDVFGDASLRTFANAGRYHLAIPLNVAFRQVGGSTNTTQYFSFTSVDPNTFEPIGTADIGSGPFSPNQEYGQARDPDLAAAQGLESYYQDELSLGLESKLMPSLVGGARFIYRELGSQIDDNCDSRPAYNWAVSHGYVSDTDTSDLYSGDAYGDVQPGDAGPNGLDDRAEYIGAQLAQCRIINPGESNKLLFEDIDADADGVADATPTKFAANISAAEWGLPKLDRTYEGLDLFLEHPMRDNWYGKLDWTISRNQGNAEGQLLSDIGQQDVSVTLNWDHPELMKGANGYLPNDRRHQIKAWGFYQFSPEWRASLTMTAMSGRPKSATGVYGGTPLLDVEPSAVGTCDAQCYYSTYVDYGGQFYRFVNGEASPRGTAGRLPWTTTFDAGASYAPNILKNQLKVAVDVFNVFNTQKAQSQIDIVENLAVGQPYHSGNRYLGYNAPRSVRFSVRYDWGL